MRVVSYKDLPLLIAKDSKRIKIAGKETLNQTAFKSLPAITKQAQQDMKFRKNARQAMGFRVDKASKANLEVKIWSNRGWLNYHLQKGTRKTEDGWRFRGRDYMMIPVFKEAFTARGKIKAGFYKRLYIVEDAKGALVFFRPKRGDRKAKLIAVLRSQSKFSKDTDPKEVITKIFRRNATRWFKQVLHNPGARLS